MRAPRPRLHVVQHPAQSMTERPGMVAAWLWQAMKRANNWMKMANESVLKMKVPMAQCGRLLIRVRHHNWSVLMCCL